MQISRDQITAGILAGGAGRRMGGVDKGWYDVEGRALIEHTIARIRPQAATFAISANRSLARYLQLGGPVVCDTDDAYRGPLAGVARLLGIAQTPFVLTVPVDTPALPLDLANRLAAAMDADVDLVVARCEGRRQPLHALLRRGLCTPAERALAEGRLRMIDWQDGLSVRFVDWPDCRGFANINRPADALRASGQR